MMSAVFGSLPGRVEMSMRPPLGIAPAAFLNRLVEAVGEVRRYVLDLLRRGEADNCERLLGTIDEIYGLLVTLDYPDALASPAHIEDAMLTPSGAVVPAQLRRPYSMLPPRSTTVR